MAGEVDGLKLGIGHFNACRIGVWIELAMDVETSFGGGSGDQLDDNLMADERFAAPVSGDEGKQAVLDLVPLAGAGRQVAYVIEMPSSFASFCSSIFHNRTREPLLPPPSAVISNVLACGKRSRPISFRQLRIALVANAAVSSIRLASVALRGLRPPPDRRTRSPSGVSSSASSSNPRRIVLRAMPVARITALTPPGPAANASAAAKRRRPCSSSTGASASNRTRIADSSITRI
jgi:hypothetical protein